jgi:hypothetical protein
MSCALRAAASASPPHCHTPLQQLDQAVAIIAG